MGNWFGNLDLAYKYTVVFLSLLVLTLLAGFIKVLYDRRKLKKFAAQQNEEAGPREEQMELNQREKDEGDLFGIRAIEAGFYAGIPQSRPTSRAGSIAGSPSMSSSTLIGGFNSPKVQTHSMSSSVTTLPLAHTTDRNRDSDTLPSPAAHQRRSPPTIKLRPSEAELNGRINHSAAVNMSLNVPPSPVLARPPQSPAFGGSDSGESDGQHTPRSRSPGYTPDHYAPVPPQIPMPDGLRVSVVSAENVHKSQAASFNDPSPSHSPAPSLPPSPGHPPQTKLPSMPARAFRDDSRSPPPVRQEPEARTEQPNTMTPERPSSPVRLLPQTYQPYRPSHQRDESSASSVYSDKRTSTHQAEHQRNSSVGSYYNYSFPENSDRNSTSLSTGKESVSSSLLAPGSSHSNQTNDPRLSEFYDAYYRHSQLNPVQKAEAVKRPNQLNLAQPTIVEVPSPLASPQPGATGSQPGMAL